MLPVTFGNDCVSMISPHNKQLDAQQLMGGKENGSSTGGSIGILSTSSISTNTKPVQTPSHSSRAPGHRPSSAARLAQSSASFKRPTCKGGGRTAEHGTPYHLNYTHEMRCETSSQVDINIEGGQPIRIDVMCHTEIRRSEPDTLILSIQPTTVL